MSSFTLGGEGAFLAPRAKTGASKPAVGTEDSRQKSSGQSVVSTITSGGMSSQGQTVMLDNSSYGGSSSGEKSGTAVLSAKAADDIRKTLGRRDATVKAGFDRFKASGGAQVRQLPAKGGSSSAGPAKVSTFDSGGIGSCLTPCDAVYITLAERYGRGVTVTLEKDGKCARVALTVEQVKAAAPVARDLITNRFKMSKEQIAACIAQYCKSEQGGCPGSEAPPAPPVSDTVVCAIVYLVKAAQYGRAFSMTKDGIVTNLSADGVLTISKDGKVLATYDKSRSKDEIAKFAAILKSMIDRKMTTPEVVALCERQYCDQYGCIPNPPMPPPPPKPPAQDTGTGGGGGGSGGAGGSECPEGYSYDVTINKCVANEIEGPAVTKSKKNYWWIVAAGALAFAAKKYLVVGALAGAPKLIELDEEEEEEED